MKYNQYPLNHIKKLIAKGQEATTEFDNIDSFLYNIDCDFDEVEFLGLGFKNPDFDVDSIEIKEYYRIGEPTLIMAVHINIHTTLPKKDQKQGCQ